MVAARVVMPIVVVLVAAAGLAAAQDDSSLAAQYERKMEVFNATLAAATAYTQAFEDLQAYAAIAREAGGVLRPGFGAKLEEFIATGRPMSEAEYLALMRERYGFDWR